MASDYTVPFLVTMILVLHPWPATSNNLSSIFSPIFVAGGDVCNNTECGKGTCKPSNDSTTGFVCECEAGWKQGRPDHDDGLKFLPCVIPNCTLNFSCSKAASPAPAREKQANESIFDPCYWSDCGGGTCTKTSLFTHKCNCQEGYYNILNVTAFPCFKECALGMDCKSLGIGIMNNSNSSPPSLSEDGKNQATSIPIGDLNRSIFLMLSLAFVLWK